MCSDERHTDRRCLRQCDPQSYVKLLGIVGFAGGIHGCAGHGPIVDPVAGRRRPGCDPTGIDRGVLELSVGGRDADEVCDSVPATCRREACSPDGGDERRLLNGTIPGDQWEAQGLRGRDDEPVPRVTERGPWNRRECIRDVDVDRLQRHPR